MVFLAWEYFMAIKSMEDFWWAIHGAHMPIHLFKAFMLTSFHHFFFKLTFKNSGSSVTSIFKLIFQKLQFPNSIFFLRIPFSNKFPKFNF